METYVPFILWERGQTFKLAKQAYAFDDYKTFIFEANTNSLTVKCSNYTATVNLPNDAEFFETGLLLNDRDYTMTLILLAAKDSAIKVARAKTVKITNAQTCSELNLKTFPSQIGGPKKLILVSDPPEETQIYVSIARLIAQRQASQKGFLFLPPEIITHLYPFLTQQLNISLDESGNTLLIPPIVFRWQSDPNTTQYIYSGVQIVKDEQNRVFRVYYYDEGIKTLEITSDQLGRFSDGFYFGIPMDLTNDPDTLEMYLTTGFLPQFTTDFLKNIDTNQFRQEFCNIVSSTHTYYGAA